MCGRNLIINSKPLSAANYRGEEDLSQLQLNVGQYPVGDVKNDGLPQPIIRGGTCT